MKGSREKFTQVLVLDGAVGALETAARLANDLFATYAEFSPQFNRTKKGNAQ